MLQVWKKAYCRFETDLPNARLAREGAAGVTVRSRHTTHTFVTTFRKNVATKAQMAKFVVFSMELKTASVFFHRQSNR